MILWHGTSASSAERIMAEGFRANHRRVDWKENMQSQDGFVYLTDTYAAVFACCAAKAHKDKHGAIVVCRVAKANLYPDEDFLWQASGLPSERWHSHQLDIREYKRHALKSLQRLGNVAARPMVVTPLKMVAFDALEDSWRYIDPSIGLVNHLVMNVYYRRFSEGLLDGKTIDEVGQSLDQGACIGEALASRAA